MALSLSGGPIKQNSSAISFDEGGYLFQPWGMCWCWFQQCSWKTYFILESLVWCGQTWRIWTWSWAAVARPTILESLLWRGWTQQTWTQSARSNGQHLNHCAISPDSNKTGHYTGNEKDTANIPKLSLGFTFYQTFKLVIKMLSWNKWNEKNMQTQHKSMQAKVQ